MRKSRCRGKLSLTFRESAITIKTGTIGERTIMKITYIHHSTFCVEVAGKALVFDYYNGKGLPSCEYHGKLPDYPKETQIYVFASHSHRDHFDTEVLSWSRHYPDIHYIFAKEVKKKLGNSMLKRLGFGEEIKEKITYVKPREKHEILGLTVETLLSTDSGVAFLVTVGGKVIYHAGDLNWWRWEGETEAFNLYQEATYKHQIDQLAGRNLDISFVVVDPRQEQDKFLGIDYFMQQISSGYVVPMHLWKRYDLVGEYQSRANNGQLGRRIILFDRENQSLELE